MAYDNGITFDSLGHTPGQVDYVNAIDRDGNPLEYEIPRWEANWKYKRRNSPAIAAMMDDWDGGDPFGSAMHAAWAVAEVSRAVGDPPSSEVTQTLSYRPSPIADNPSLTELADDAEDFETRTLAEAVVAGRVEASDLVFAARVLHRYIDICERAGMSY